MARPLICPLCLSRYDDIRGIVYAVGATAGVRCDDTWHRGPGYNPSELPLTDEDRAWLKKNQIKV